MEDTAMLSHNIPSVPATESKTEKPSDLTSEDLEKLYRIITKASYDDKEPLHEALGLIRANLYAYLATDNQSTVKKQILIGQIDMLKERNFLVGKFDLMKLELIKNDILIRKLLKATIKEHQKIDFVTLLNNINDEYQMNRPTIINFPTELHTGISTSESKGIFYGAATQAWSLSSDLNNKGIEHYAKHEWHEAIKYFEEAINAEQEISSELKEKPNEENIIIYQKNMANALVEIARKFYNEDDYLKSIEKYHESITLFEKIFAKTETKKDKENIASQRRNLVHTLNYYAVECYLANKLADALIQHHAAIAEHNKIPLELISEKDELKFALLQRNLAFVVHKDGLRNMDEGKYDNAITAYQEAQKLVNAIKLELLIHDDFEFLMDIENDLEEALRMKTHHNSPSESSNARLFSRKRRNSDIEPSEESKDSKTRKLDPEENPGEGSGEKKSSP